MQRICLSALILVALTACAHGDEKTKTESFDRDPNWEGVNNRTARTNTPYTVKQDFGFSNTHRAGGKSPGEIGGYIMPSCEVAYYGKAIDTKTFNDPLTASGTFSCPDDGGFNLL